MPGDRDIHSDQLLPDAMSSQVVTEFIEKTLASIPRSDQRRWGDLYVRGLLAAEGKKTIRALANRHGRRIEQNLNQFISKSPWDCGPVRQALAHQVQQAAQPRAWVVQPLVLTKMGQHSVGVERQFVPTLGRVVNCQQGVGVWLAGERFSCPVDWCLSLPAGWTREPELRRRAAIPEYARSESPERSALGAITRMAGGWGLRRRPVVMNLRELDPLPVLRELLDRRLPFLVRIDAPARLVAPAVRPSGPGARPGSRLARLTDPNTLLTSTLRQQFLPVEWLDPVTGAIRATAVGSARVRLLDERTHRAGSPEPRDLVLLGAWSDPAGRRPDEFWLSDQSQLPVGTLYRTSKLTQRVERDQAEVSDQLGIRDFEGRSYPGWHHHMTMVSLAHAITVLSAPSRFSSASSAAAHRRTSQAPAA